MLRRFAGALMLAMLSGTVGLAQEWPAKQPVKVIVTNTPGSGLDIIARTVFAEVGQQVGQSFVIENRPGGANTIGIAAAARSEPDGYTVLVTSSSLAITPHTHRDLPYDPIRDLAPVIPLGNLTNVMVTPRGRFTSLADMVSKAKSRPDALSYASVGPGSTGHLSAVRLAQSAGFTAVHVAFKGSPQALTDITAGRVDFFFVPVLPALPLIRDNKIEAHAVSSSARSSILPEVPTTVQAGFKDSEYDFWVGAFMPAGTPPAVLDRLHDEIRKALDMPAVKERLVKMGVEPMVLDRAQFTTKVKDEIAANATLVKAAGLTAK